MPIRWHQYTKTVREGNVDLSLDDAVAETFGDGAIAGQPADYDAWFALYELILRHETFGPAGLRTRLLDSGEPWPENPGALRKAVMELVCAEILPAALERTVTDGSDADLEYVHVVEITDVDADGAVEELDTRLGDDLMAEFTEYLQKDEARQKGDG